jgi:hypothetical protein
MWNKVPRKIHIINMYDDDLLPLPLANLNQSIDQKQGPCDSQRRSEHQLFRACNCKGGDKPNLKSMIGLSLPILGGVAAPCRG